MKLEKPFFRNPVLWSFIFSFAYWVYLFLTSHMIISCDAISYEAIGEMLVKKGWVEYFSSGPHREPLYPLLVSFSMRIGSAFSLSYQSVQVFLQFLILFITQLLTLRILRLLNINEWISALTVLYLGISPAIVNSALSLYSEIATYPLILVIILLMQYSWSSFSGPKKKVILFAVLSGLAFVAITLSKGIFEVVTPAFISLFFLSAIFTRRREFIQNALIHLFIVLVVFYGLTTCYKLTNKIFNQHFLITNRGGQMLYGSAARRTEPLTGKDFLVALAYIPGEKVCKSIFGQEKCFPWSLHRYDELGYSKINQLKASGFTSAEVEKMTRHAAIIKILQKPWQFSLLWFTEGLKMFFWESTQIGFVSYPPGLTKVFNRVLFKNGLRLFMSVLTFVALTYLVIYLFRRGREIIVSQEDNRIILLWIILLISIFSSAHALCLIVPRYALPMAPLFLIISSFFAQKVLIRQN